MIIELSSSQMHLAMSIIGLCMWIFICYVLIRSNPIAAIPPVIIFTLILIIAFYDGVLVADLGAPEIVLPDLSQLLVFKVRGAP